MTIPYQVRNNLYMSCNIILNRLLLELSSLEGYLRVQMEAIFFSSMIEEWIGTNIQPIKRKLTKLKQTTENQLKQNSRI